MAEPDRPPVDGPVARRLASKPDWFVDALVCHAGPGDPAFEERHATASIAVVVEGSFTYASGTGRALLHPGALLLGNPGACYRCGHDHGTGDRCVSMQLTPEAFAEIAATAAGSSRFQFPVAMLPANRDALSHAVLLEALASDRDPMRFEEALIGFVATAVRALSGVASTPARVSAHDERRISRALRHIEAHADEPLDLDRLAAVAAMSKFHFLRVFRRAIGLTPHRFLLTTRLRRAAHRLLTTADPIAQIAFDAGFADLSTYNAQFRERFGMNPTAFRRRGVGV